MCDIDDSEMEIWRFMVWKFLILYEISQHKLASVTLYDDILYSFLNFNFISRNKSPFCDPTCIMLFLCHEAYFQIFNRFCCCVCELCTIYRIVLGTMWEFTMQICINQQFSDTFAKQIDLQEIFCTQTLCT